MYFWFKILLKLRFLESVTFVTYYTNTFYKKVTPLLALLPKRQRGFTSWALFNLTLNLKGRVNSCVWAHNLLLGKLVDSSTFLRGYYRLNDLLWQDGFLFDFLQKKIVDKWVRTFVIYSGYLFNERFVFDLVVRFYIDFVVWPGYSISLYEFNSVASTLVMTLAILLGLILLTSTYYLTLLI